MFVLILQKKKVEGLFLVILTDCIGGANLDFNADLRTNLISYIVFGKEYDLIKISLQLV